MLNTGICIQFDIIHLRAKNDEKNHLCAWHIDDYIFIRIISIGNFPPNDKNIKSVNKNPTQRILIRDGEVVFGIYGNFLLSNIYE